MAGEDPDVERPVAQPSQEEDHVEIDLPMSNQAVILTEQSALALAEDIKRIVENGDENDE